MFKLTGSIIITAAFALFGYFRCSELSARYIYLTQMRTLLSVLRSEISLRKTPVGEAFSKVGKIYNNKCFTLCGSKTLNLGAENAYKHAILRTASENHLTKSDTDALISLAAGLGKCDLENQLNRIDYTISLTDSAIEDAKKEKNEKGRMIMNCSLLAGTAVALILL